MTELLRREIVRPTQAYTNRTLVSAILIAGGGLAAGIAIAVAPDPIDAPAPHVVVIEHQAAPVPMPLVVAVEKAAPSPRASEIQLVFRVGGATYMKLAAVGDGAHDEVMPKHGKLRYTPAGEPGWTETVIAPVAERDVPAAHRGWTERTVVVEGGCTAKVTGFAVVARLTGESSYAEGDGAWNAKNVLASGNPVLAAKLDGCATGGYARDAALSPVVIPTVIEDARLVAQARAKLIASHASAEAQRQWSELELDGEWHATTPIATIVVRHPVTGVTWVSAHANASEGCGGPDVNVWGLFRVDGNGELVTAQLRDLGEPHSIASLIDVEGDGELELIASPWLANGTMIVRSGGDTLASDEVPFYGCPC